MIKVVCKLKLIFSHMPGHVRAPSGLPEIKTSGQSGLHRIQTICMEEKWLFGLPAIQHLKPTLRRTLPCSYRTLPFPLSLPEYQDISQVLLTFAIATSLLQTVLPHKPPRSRPATAPLSALTPSPCVRADSTPPARGVGVEEA